MEQKKSLFEKAIHFFSIAVCGTVCTYAAVSFAGMELLLAGVVFTLICDGALTMWLRYKWCGLSLHLLWAFLFWGMTCYTHELTVGINWQWYFLWGLFSVRILVLQPIYLYKISQNKK
jgi:hypothetical protein